MGMLATQGYVGWMGAEERAVQALHVCVGGFGLTCRPSWL